MIRTLGMTLVLLKNKMKHYNIHLFGFFFCMCLGICVHPIMFRGEKSDLSKLALSFQHVGLEIPCELSGLVIIVT